MSFHSTLKSNDSKNNSIYFWIKHCHYISSYDNLRKRNEKGQPDGVEIYEKIFCTLHFFKALISLVAKIVAKLLAWFIFALIFYFSLTWNNPCFTQNKGNKNKWKHVINNGSCNIRVRLLSSLLLQKGIIIKVQTKLLFII